VALQSERRASRPDLRGRIAARLDANDHRGAWAAMTEVISVDPSTANCHAVAEGLERLDAAQAGLTELRVGVLANFTAQPLATLLAARAVTSGILLRPYVAPFDSWMAEAIDEKSGLRRHAPDVIVFALTLDALAPALVVNFLGLDHDRARQMVDETASAIDTAIRHLRSWTPAKVLLHSFPFPAARALGIIDAVRKDGQTEAFRALNGRLRTLADRERDVWIVDLDRLIATVGDGRWRDPRMEVIAGIPFTPAAMHAIAEEHLRYLRAFSGRVRKVLVLDGDDTLWGGIVGEVGVGGVSLGDGYPGACFVQFQRAVLELRRRGVLIALNSSNNPEDVDQMLAHPRMLLRAADFSAVRVNWSDKAANIVSIADELSVGLDSIVAIDDSAAECERLRTALPEVVTIHLDGDPALRADVVRNLGVFDALSYGDDDRNRADRYREESARTQLRRELPTLEEYYESLGMELRVEPIGPTTIARAAELSQRTNQFNLLPRRFSRDELAVALAERSTEGYVFGLRDRFGDHGLIAVALLEHEGDRSRIATFLVSCRVLKRTVEDTVLAFVAARARERGAAVLEGRFRPAARNQSAATFFAARRFTLTSRDDDGTEIYQSPIDRIPAASPFVRLAAHAADGV